MIRSNRHAFPLAFTLVCAIALHGCSSLLDATGKGESPNAEWIWKETTDVNHITPAYDSARHHLYVVSNRRELLALNASSGKEVWRNKYLDGAPRGINIVVAGDLVFVGDVDVWAFRATTGQLVWILSREGGNEGLRTIASDGGTIFVSAFDGLVQRMSQSATTLWSTYLRDEDGTLNASGNTLVGSSLYVCGMNFASPDRNGTLFALDAATGVERWRYRYTPALPGQSAICAARVAHAGELIFSAQDDGRIFAHEATTGAVRWIIPRIHSPPGDPNGPGNGAYDDRRVLAADDESLIATSDDGSVVCYSTRDGTQRWRAQGPGIALDPAVLSSGMALVTHVGYTVAYDLASGRVLWTQPSTDPHSLDSTRYYTQPVLFGDTLIIAGSAGVRARRLSRN